MNGANRTVTHAYVMGISEGRATWRQFERDGIANLETAREALGHVQECLAMGFAGDVRDMMRGERDFWRQRIKVLAEQAARPAPIPVRRASGTGPPWPPADEQRHLEGMSNVYAKD